MNVAVAFWQFYKVKRSEKWRLSSEYSCKQLADEMIKFEIDVKSEEIETLCQTKPKKNKKSRSDPRCIVAKVKSLGWESIRFLKVRQMVHLREQNNSERWRLLQSL